MAAQEYGTRKSGCEALENTNSLALGDMAGFLACLFCICCIIAVKVALVVIRQDSKLELLIITFRTDFPRNRECNAYFDGDYWAFVTDLRGIRPCYHEFRLWICLFQFLFEYTMSPNCLGIFILFTEVFFKIPRGGKVYFAIITFKLALAAVYPIVLGLSVVNINS